MERVDMVFVVVESDFVVCRVLLHVHFLMNER
jgi:hypothetical protein